MAVLPLKWASKTSGLFSYAKWYHDNFYRVNTIKKPPAIFARGVAESVISATVPFGLSGPGPPVVILYAIFDFV